MKQAKAPAPPDPVVTAGAQTSQNIGTAIAQQQMNNVNQVTPDGKLTYKQSGSFRYRDPNSGKTHLIPQYTATQTLSEAQQAIKAQQDAADLSLATVGNQQTQKIGDLLGEPINLDNEATESRLMELGRKRLDPALDRRRDAMASQLASQGIGHGSEAYDRAMEGLNEGENDAYNQLLLNGRAQAVQEALTERNQPINETTALMSGAQVSMPQFVGTNPAQMANTDVAGIHQQDFANRMGIYNQQQGRRDQLMGGLFGLAGSGVRAAGGFI